LETVVVHLCIFQLSLIASQGGLGLFERNLIGARINDEQHVSLFYELTFPESNLDDLAIDPAFQTHSIRGLHTPQTGKVHGKILAFGCGDGYRNGLWTGTGLGRFCARSIATTEHRQEYDGKYNDETGSLRSERKMKTFRFHSFFRVAEIGATVNSTRARFSLSGQWRRSGQKSTNARAKP
jgi:hypothetical protein